MPGYKQQYLHLARRDMKMIISTHAIYLLYYFFHQQDFKYSPQDSLNASRTKSQQNEVLHWTERWI
jgi:hypothetical protein